VSAKTEQVLVKAGVLPHPANEWAGRLDQAMELAEVRQDILRSHFLAQILHESGMLRTTVERFNYSARRLFQVFPKYFRSMEAAMSAVNRPNREEYIANIVYANRMGNGPPSSGDGWRSVVVASSN
jgi:predicted chitinase